MFDFTNLPLGGFDMRELISDKVKLLLESFKGLLTYVVKFMFDVT